MKIKALTSVVFGVITVLATSNAALADTSGGSSGRCLPAPAVCTPATTAPVATVAPVTTAAPVTTVAPAPATTVAPAPATTVAPAPATTVAPAPTTTAAPTTTVAPAPAAVVPVGVPQQQGPTPGGDTGSTPVDPTVPSDPSLQVTPAGQPKATPKATPKVTPQATPQVTPQVTPVVTPLAVVAPAPLTSTSSFPWVRLMEGLGIAGLIALRARARSKERARSEEATSELDSMLGETEVVKKDFFAHPVFGHRSRVS